jgi:L-ascorbate metabolism protein UlaG (beta-lactamase superfamily)
MIVNFLGEDSFKISQGDLSLVVNPHSKISADVTLFSSGRAETSEKSGFVIDGPGEYEIKDVFIKGFLSDGAKRLNTVYVFNFEGMNICYLGRLSSAELKSEALEAMENIDILIVPVGGGEVLDPAAANKLAVSLEPSVIIPMLADKSALAQFVKEGGESAAEPIDKFVVKKKDLEGKEGEIIIIKEEN